jgi:hypothetical protein
LEGSIFGGSYIFGGTYLSGGFYPFWGLLVRSCSFLLFRPRSPWYFDTSCVNNGSIDLSSIMASLIFRDQNYVSSAIHFVCLYTRLYTRQWHTFCMCIHTMSIYSMYLVSLVLWCFVFVVTESSSGKNSVIKKKIHKVWNFCIGYENIGCFFLMPQGP